jgi:NADPH:quinone reductase-like Zn-dependent oxidoreductase
LLCGQVNRLLVKHCSLIGIYLYAFADQEPEKCKQMWAEVYAQLESGAYTPVVYSVVPGLANVGRAMGMLQNREVWGKVVVGLGGEAERERANLAKL